MNILDSNLKSVEKTGLRTLDLSGKVTGEILIYNAVGGGEEGEDVGDEVTFIVGEAFPILEVRGQVNFLSGPEAGLGLFIHVPNLYLCVRKRIVGVSVLCH